MVQDLQAKLQQEMDSVKEETKKQIDSLNDKLDEVKKQSDQRVAKSGKKAEQCTIM